MNEIPAWLNEVFEVRRSIGDPVTADFIFVNELPQEAPQNNAYTTGDGEYKFFDGVEWRLYTLKFSDGYIQGLVEGFGRIRASIKLIDNLMARIDPADYLTSGNAGGQSVSFPSLGEIMAYYGALRVRLLEEEAAAAGMNSGLMVRTKRRPVGGVLETDDE
jgi:hypothetical protein